jgi:hypothetical protein
MTPLQLKILDQVREWIAVGGIEPTYQEIADGVGCARSQAFRSVAALVEAGHLTKRPGSRGVRLADRADLRAVPSDELRGELARRGETLEALSRHRDESATGRGRPCALESCAVLVGRGQLFCRQHWFALPAELQGAVKRTWAARDERAFGQALLHARDWLERNGRRRA